MEGPKKVSFMTKVITQPTSEIITNDMDTATTTASTVNIIIIIITFDTVATATMDSPI
jgi:hypothetical protein